MIVGFTINDFNGHEEDAIRFIQEVCILEDPQIAKNIVEAGTGVNIYSNALHSEILSSLPFRVTPIELETGKYILVSIVNFNLELLYNNRILRLVPTEFVYVLPSEVEQFEEYVKQGLVRFIPEVNKSGSKWILNKGYWDDNGVWIDSEYWKDSNEWN